MYTIFGPQINGRIQVYLQKAASYLVSQVGDNLIAVILFGGFGKGEGSIEIVDGEAVPFNDFDFYIIVKKKLSEKELSKLMVGASQAIGFGGLDFIEHPDAFYDRRKFFHVDVRDIQYAKLRYLGRTQRTFELKYKSQVIWGDKLVLDLIPKIKENDLPLAEGIRNLLNKINTQVLAIKPFIAAPFSNSYWRGQKIRAGENAVHPHTKSSRYDVEPRRNHNKPNHYDTLVYHSENFAAGGQKKIFVFYCAKSYLSITEALLISAGKFKPSYQERVKLFKKIFADDFPEIKKQIPDLIQKIDWALDLKLRLNWDFSRNLVNLWFEARNDIMIALDYLLRRIVNMEAARPDAVHCHSGKSASNSLLDYDDVFYNKLPFSYFTPYIEDKLVECCFPKPAAKLSAKHLFWLQYYLNVLYWRKLKSPNCSLLPAASILLNWKDIGLRLAPPLLWLFLSFEKKGGINQKYFEKARASMAKIVSEKNIKNDFNGLRCQILDYFGAYYMQRLL